MQLEFRKIILIGLLAFICITLLQRWTEFQQQYPAGIGASGTSSEQKLADEEIPSAPETAQMPQTDEIPSSESAPEKEGAIILVKTDLIVAKINLNGGEITELDLIKYPVSVDTPDIPFKLLKFGGADIFTAQSGLIGKQEREYPNHKTVFTAKQTRYQLESGQDELNVTLSWRSPDKVLYNKVFTFKRDDYQVDIDFEIQNKSNSAWEGYLYAQFQRSDVQTETFGFFGGSPTYKGGVIYDPVDKYKKIKFGDLAEDQPNVIADSGWVGMLQHYFAGIWLPDMQGPYQFYGTSLDRAGQTLYNIGYKTTTPLEIAPGGQGALQTRAYIGPKAQNRLNAQDVEGLVLTVDYGWLTVIASPLFWVMNEIHGWVKNWGWTIVIVTIFLKLLFFPLSAASYKSMAKMKKFQPRLMTLRERHGDDRQKLNAEMMKLYKQEKINPMGGCLPILIQIPVFIALYWVLLESVELRQAPFIGWIQDLSLKDPYYVLPVLYGISMFAMQKLNPAPIDPIQQKVMTALPLVFTMLFLWFPAGLVLYWLVNNILSMSQQWYITRKYA